MEQYINKSAVKSELERIEYETNYEPFTEEVLGKRKVCKDIKDFIDTIEAKEVNIAEMADEYYDALMEEAADWMDEGTMGHCRLAYYTGCKDVLAKLQKGE